MFNMLFAQLEYKEYFQSNIKIGKGVHVIAIKISSQQLLQSENGDYIQSTP